MQKAFKILALLLAALGVLAPCGLFGAEKMPSVLALKSSELKPGENALADLHHDLLDLEIEIELKTAQQVTLNLRGQEIVYDVKAQKLKVFGRALSLAPMDGKLVLRALLDRTSIELFGNRGEVTHSVDFFADPENRNLALTVEGGGARVQRLVVRELRSIWDPPAQ